MMRSTSQFIGMKWSTSEISTSMLNNVAFHDVPDALAPLVATANSLSEKSQKK
jgi:hypothetical protein